MVAIEEEEDAEAGISRDRFKKYLEQKKRRRAEMEGGKKEGADTGSLGEKRLKETEGSSLV